MSALQQFAEPASMVGQRPPARHRRVTALIALGALLVLAAFVIHLGAGRWGAYIRSPVPGLYLADLLFALGAAASLFALRRLFDWSSAVLALFAAVGVYLLARGLVSLVWAPVAEPYLVLRDLAPFAYLLLVPMVAVILRTVTLRAFIWVIRVAVAAHLVSYFLVWWGIVSPFPSPWLGTEHVGVLEYRRDLLGVAFGIGFLAWGRWPGVVSASRSMQLLFLAFGIGLTSRASLLALLFVVVLVLWRERQWFPPLRSGALVAAALLVALSLGVLKQGLPDWRAPFGAAGLDESGALAPAGAPETATPRLPPAGAEPGAPGVAPRPLTGDDSLAPSLAKPRQPPVQPLLPPLQREPAPDAADQAPELTADDLLPRAIQRQIRELERASGTMYARIDTWRMVIAALPKDSRWLVGGGLGSDILFRICTVYSVAPGDRAPRKCRVDSGRAPTVLRDPHNWLLNLLLYHGVVGTSLFVLAVAVPIWHYRRTRFSSLPIIAIGAYFVSGSFGVILSSPFGMLPVAVFLAWLLREGAGPVPGFPPGIRIASGGPGDGDVVGGEGTTAVVRRPGSVLRRE